MTQTETTTSRQHRRRRSNFRNHDWLFIGAVAALVAFLILVVVLYNG